MSILLFVLVLVALILAHELGHFGVAKFFGIKVDQFNIGFPPRLFSIKKGETLYSFNLLLLGGYVQIHGENPEDGAHDARALSSRSRPVQAAVLLAGVAANLLFAWLLLSAGYVAGLPTAADHQGFGTVTNAHPMVVGVLPGSPAQKVGLQAGDIVQTVEIGGGMFDARGPNDGNQADNLRTFIGAHAEQSMVFTVLRGKEEKIFLAKAAEGLVDGRKAVGIELANVGELKLPPHLALYQGAILTKNIAVQTVLGLGTLVRQIAVGQPDFSQVAGPIGIVSLGGLAVKEGVSAVVVLAASISVALAVFNLVPIPGLDGGRLVIVLVEGAIRRPVSAKLVTGMTLAGMGLLVLLMLVVSYHDIAKLIG